MAWYKTVTYRKTQVCANTTELGRVISFCLTRKFFSTTVANDLSRANQIDMTGPNSVVLFAQTLVCSLCNYYISLSLNVMLCYFIFGSVNPNYRKNSQRFSHLVCTQKIFCHCEYRCIFCRVLCVRTLRATAHESKIAKQNDTCVILLSFAGKFYVSIYLS